MTSVLLFGIALLAPWVVHLAPPRRRLLAIALIVGALLLFLIFASNPFTSWVFWVGLALGILSILGLAAFGGGGSGGGRSSGGRPSERLSSGRRSSGRRPSRIDESTKATGHL